MPLSGWMHGTRTLGTSAICLLELKRSFTTIFFFAFILLSSFTMKRKVFTYTPVRGILARFRCRIKRCCMQKRGSTGSAVSSSECLTAAANLRLLHGTSLAMEQCRGRSLRCVRGWGRSWRCRSDVVRPYIGVGVVVCDKGGADAGRGDEEQNIVVGGGLCWSLRRGRRPSTTVTKRSRAAGSHLQA